MYKLVTLCCLLLCYAMLCYAMLCYAMHSLAMPDVELDRVRDLHLEVSGCTTYIMCFVALTTNCGARLIPGGGF